jgi:hypothetical protein
MVHFKSMQRLWNKFYKYYKKQKCYFGEAKFDYLGYEITRDGIQPQPKKVEAILKHIN